MVGEAFKNNTLSLREKAILAWQQERPMREAALIEERAKQLADLRIKLGNIFGKEYKIIVGLNYDGNVIATVDDLRFLATTYSIGIVTIALIENCPYCGEEVSIGVISNLADVGEALEKFYSSFNHECKS